MTTSTTTTTFRFPIIDIFHGTGDSLRLSRETACMFLAPDGHFAWSPQGVPTESYPHPRLNLISHQKCHEAILRRDFEIEVASPATPHAVAISLHSRLVEEMGVCEFVYLLVGDHPAFTSVLGPCPGEADRAARPKRDPVEELALLQEARHRANKSLLVILPPPEDLEQHEKGPINALKDGMEITVDEIEAGLRKAMGTKTLEEFFAWIAGFSFSDVSALSWIPVLRDTLTIPPHVLYIPDVVGQAMIWNPKTKNYENA